MPQASADLREPQGHIPRSGGVRSGATARGDLGIAQAQKERCRPVFASVFVPMGVVDSPNMLVRKDRLRLARRGCAAAAAAASYYECLAVMFSTARRWHETARLVLFTPDAVPAWFERLTQRLDLEVVPLPFRHLPPDAQSGRHFVSSLYTLDAVDWIAAQGDDDEVFILLDADTVLLGPLTPARWSQRLGYLGWPLKDGYFFGGLPLAKYREFVLKSGLSESIEPEVVGGEFLAGRTAVFQALSRETARVERLNAGSAVNGVLPLTTEEQILSLAVPYMERDNSLDVANRIWTAAHYRTVEGNEDELLIWHLPSEKGRGFRKVARAAMDGRSWLWTASSARFIDQVGGAMGVTSRTMNRSALDWIRMAKRRRFKNEAATGERVLWGPPW